MDQQGCKDSIFLIYPEIWSLILLDLFYNEIIEPAANLGKCLGRFLFLGYGPKCFQNKLIK